MNAEPVRRFYAAASPAEQDGAHVVRLDQRTLRTPSGKSLHLPSRALAELVAGEWDVQGEFIAPSSMPITRFAFAAIDLIPQKRDEVAGDLAKYVETDLVAHRAEAPVELVARQAEVWNPIVAWAERRFGVSIPIVTGVLPASAPAQNREALLREMNRLNDFRALGLAQAATLAGSILIGFAFLEGELDAEKAFAAAALDDLWSQETWGEDAEAGARLDRQRAEWAALQRFVTALGE
jgi:chaperone required for assembly of F1-ATPase